MSLLSRSASMPPVSRSAVQLCLAAALAAPLALGAAGASSAAPVPAGQAPHTLGHAVVMLPSSVLKATYTDSAGTTSTYHLYTSGLPGGVAKGLVVYLDGDGMYGHDNPSSTWALGGSRGVVESARARGYATLSIRTPDRTGTPTFWENGRVNAAYVASLIAKTSRDLGTSSTWLVGYSGGAQLITQFLVPAHAAALGAGGAVIAGGGGTPRVTPTAFDPAQQARFPMHWYTGSRDDGTTASDGYNALADAKKGSAWYADRGFRVSRAEPAGLDHDDLGTRFGTVLAGQLDANPAPSGSSTPTPAPTTPTPAPTTPTPAPTTPAPTTPAPTTPAPSQASWPTSVDPGRRSVRVDVDVPSTARGTVRLRVTATSGSASGRTWTTSTSTRGRDVSLAIRYVLPRDTSYRYVVEHDGAGVASGTFRTS